MIDWYTVEFSIANVICKMFSAEGGREGEEREGGSEGERERKREREREREREKNKEGKREKHHKVKSLRLRPSSDHAAVRTLSSASGSGVIYRL